MSHASRLLTPLVFALALAAGPGVMQAQTLDSFDVIPDGFPTSAAATAEGNLVIGGQFLNISGTARSRLARLSSDGAVAADLTAGATTGTQITAVLLRPDGTILVGGAFSQFATTAHANLAQVQANGTVDATFTTNANGAVSALALQRDNKVLVGGVFTSLGGEAHARIGRLNANGTVDSGFTPSANDDVVTMLVQADDGIVIAGRFTDVNGSPRNRMARLSVSGALDATFNPDVNGLVAGMAQQADGKILIYGTFTTVGGVAHNHYARLNANGSVDDTFVLLTNTSIDSMVAQADGKVLVAGIFSGGTVSGTRIIRVNDDGSLDGTFTPVSSSLPAHLILDGTGHVYAAGGFTTFAGQPRRYLARLANPTPAVQDLEVDVLGDVVWTLEGSMPVPSMVSFSASVDGLVWTDLGAGTHNAGVWTLASPTLPGGATQIRAHGVVPTNGSDSSEIRAVALLTPGAPLITTQPVSQALAAGADLVLSVVAAGDGTLTYQWKLDGTDITGATSSTLTVPSAQVSHSGSYTVVVTNSLGSVESGASVVTITTPADSSARMLNISTRALVGTGADVMIPGFVLGGTGTKRVLIRAVGPTLGQDPFNVANVLPDPEMVLRRFNPALGPNGAYEDIANNDEWMTNANAVAIAAAAVQVGAFGLNDNHESALLMDLEPGQYTVAATGVNSATGVAIVEVYDADVGASTANVVNLSNRGFAGVGDQVMIPGFVISAEGSKTVLLRVVGPTLAGAPYNVPGTMVDPMLTLYRRENNGSQTEIAAQNDWGDDADPDRTAQVAQQVSAFPLAAGSADAAIVVTLAPGVYSVIGSSAVTNGTGVILVELYVVP